MPVLAQPLVDGLCDNVLLKTAASAEASVQRRFEQRIRSASSPGRTGGNPFRRRVLQLRVRERTSMDRSWAATRTGLREAHHMRSVRGAGCRSSNGRGLPLESVPALPLATQLFATLGSMISAGSWRNNSSIEKSPFRGRPLRHPVPILPTTVPVRRIGVCLTQSKPAHRRNSQGPD